MIPVHPSLAPNLSLTPTVQSWLEPLNFTLKIEATRRQVCHPPVTRPPTPTGTVASVPNSPPSLLSQRMTCLHSHQKRTLLVHFWCPGFRSSHQLNTTAPRAVMSPHWPVQPPMASSLPPIPGALLSAYGYAPKSHLMFSLFSLDHCQELNGSPSNSNVEALIPKYLKIGPLRS